MTDQRFELFQDLKSAILTTTGSTALHIREALARFGADTDPTPHEGTIPPEILVYSSKVAQHAYCITDQDIAQLLTQGYSEDVIFEVTLSVALGASNQCLEQGMAALKGAIHASEEH